MICLSLCSVMLDIGIKSDVINHAGGKNGYVWERGDDFFDEKFLHIVVRRIQCTAASDDQQSWPSHC